MASNYNTIGPRDPYVVPPTYLSIFHINTNNPRATNHNPLKAYRPAVRPTCLKGAGSRENTNEERTSNKTIKTSRDTRQPPFEPLKEAERPVITLRVNTHKNDQAAILSVSISHGARPAGSLKSALPQVVQYLALAEFSWPLAQILVYQVWPQNWQKTWCRPGLKRWQ
jgi:hypothetical protein